MKFKNIEEQDLINLIKDELTHIRLINGLEILGLNADNYYLNLNEIIFKLAGIKASNDKFFEKYMEKCRRVNNIDIFKSPELLHDMAVQLYYELKKESETRKGEGHNNRQ